MYKMYRTTPLRPNAIMLPNAPFATHGDEFVIHAAFMRALRAAPGRLEIKILNAIQSCADATDNSDAYVSKILVDMGLRAPRLAFPSDFLDHIDAAVSRSRLHANPLNVPYVELIQHWQMTGDDRTGFASVTASSWERHSFLQH